MDIEVALTRANVLEFNKATMARFLHRINRYIHDIVKLYHCASLDDLVHQAIREEAQQKRRLTLRKSYPNGPNNWKAKEKEKESPRKEKSLKKGSSIPKGHKEERMLPSPVLHPNEDGTTNSDSSKIDSLSNNDSEASYEYSPDEEGDLLMVTLKPLSPKEVNEDQIKMKLRREEEKNTRRRKKKMRKKKEKRT
ncbi:hypothetical protein CR513_01699, partial [Mucuna pruriens]